MGKTCKTCVYRELSQDEYEFICTNEESEGYGLEVEFDDSCDMYYKDDKEEDEE